MENCVFKQISTEGGTSLRLHVTLLENSLQLILLQNDNSWKSVVLKNDLNHFAQQHKLSIEDYCLQLLEYIQCNNPDTIFAQREKEFVVNRLLDGSLKVKFFTCKLHKVNYVEQVEQIMDSFYTENTLLSTKLSSVVKENNEIRTNKTECESKLKELVSRRILDEEEQFGRFVTILNEKKHRIQHLTELLEAFKKGRATSNPTVTVQNRKRKNIPVKKKETVSESESSDGSQVIEEYTSDDDNSKPSTSTKPQVSTQDFDFLGENVTDSHKLPKRIKTKSCANVVVAAPKPPETPPKAEPKSERSESPQIDLSTQQLLDML